MSLTVAVLKEQAEGERRVALDPTGVGKLAGLGLRVLFQSGAGDAAGFSDAQYADAELITDESAALSQADIYLWVQVPSEQRLSQLKTGAIGMGQVYAHRNRAAVDALKANNTSCLAMELVPQNYARPEHGRAVFPGHRGRL